MEVIKIKLTDAKGNTIVISTIAPNIEFEHVEANVEFEYVDSIADYHDVDGLTYMTTALHYDNTYISNVEYDIDGEHYNHINTVLEYNTKFNRHSATKANRD